MGRKTGVQFSVESYQKLEKWYLVSPCKTLIIINRGFRANGVMLEIELRPPLYFGVAVNEEKGAFGSPSTIVVHLAYLSDITW